MNRRKTWLLTAVAIVLATVLIPALATRTRARTPHSAIGKKADEGMLADADLLATCRRC